MKRILKVQKEIGSLSKKATNPFFKSAYLDLNDLLNAIQPLLHKEGLILVQPIEAEWVKSKIIDTESGEVLLSSEMCLPEIKDPQKLGSCITYFRRYTLKSLLAIAEKDDDGNLGSSPEKDDPIGVDKEEMTPKHKLWAVSKAAILQETRTIAQLKKKYRLSTENEKLLKTK